ncbi:hypothetical protein [Chitinophaga deserti]|uniref:hypothetical protein n=1 Tax=Chitinophaga deserti TaxID=2164099 RepID=UPI000D6B37C6|nr:hypothetical protein [Chitinophaga deserti]
MKNLSPALLLALCAACNQASKPTTGDTSIIQDVKELVPVTPPPAVDIHTAQLQAQDSVFDDGSIPTSWENAGFSNPQEFKMFLARFKTWVKLDQRDSIASVIRFPLRLYPSAADFKSQYTNIFDPALKQAVDTLRLDRIFRNSQGAMIANGRIWFAPLPEGYRIIAINAR